MRVMEISKRYFSRFVVLVVGVYCAVYALAFVRLYFMEHPYVKASRWIFDNVPPGSRIIGPHWDDRVPVSIPGKNSSIYVMEGRDTELPIYERDTPQMAELLVRKMAAADYIGFATPRMADSIPRIPDEYPRTTALIQLLWAEKLGFKFVYAVKNRPSFLGLTFNDDLADESFSVYDHPKVTVFQNVERLSPQEMLTRINNSDQYEPLPTMDEMLLMDQGGWQPGHRLWNAAWNPLLWALLLTQVLGVSVWVLVAGYSARLSEVTLGLGSLVGVFVGAALGWGLASIGLLPLTARAGQLIIVGLALWALVRLALRPKLASVVMASLRKHGLFAFASFICGAAVVAAMRSGDAGLFGPGDHVESTYITYFIRNQSLPLYDILRPGQELLVAAFDRFALGWLLKAAGIPVASALEAVFLLSGAMIGGALYSLWVIIVGRPRVACLAVAISIIPSLYVLYIWRDSRNQTIAGEGLIQQTSHQVGLIKWADRTLVSAPVVVEACDEAAVRGVSTSIGLPTFADTIVGAQANAPQNVSAQTLCSTTDPDYAYTTMMRYGLPLFITAGSSSTQGSMARERLEKFGARTDLFAKVYDDGGFVIFAPAFSDYFKNIYSE